MYKKKLLYISICFCFMASLIIYPSVASDGVKYGLSLCATVIIPSLFPFTVLALIVFKLNVPFLNKSTAIMLLSHLGGYPVGAKLVDAAYKENEIDKIAKSKVRKPKKVTPGYKKKMKAQMEQVKRQERRKRK